MIKVAINGFGRIGRLACRIGLLKFQDKIDFVAVNTSGSMDASGWAHLLKFDTTYREFELPVDYQEIRKANQVKDDQPEIGKLLIDNVTIPLLAQRDPAKLPWKRYEVDVVIESTGVFTDSEGAKKHAQAGARRVVISAPPQGSNIETYVLGANEYTGEGEILSNASCTTNCVAPVAAVIHHQFGIEKATLTTIHAYTDDQKLQDGSHKDLRRARAAAANLVPTSTGAATATTATIPELKGLFDGIAIRIPVICGSLSDMVFITKRKVTKEEINDAFIKAAQTPPYKDILSVTTEPIVSSDIIGSTFSAIIDLSFTQVIGGNLVKVLAWYDNEWAYSHRLVEQVIRVGETLKHTSAPTDPLTQQFQS